MKNSDTFAILSEGKNVLFGHLIFLDGASNHLLSLCADCVRLLCHHCKNDNQTIMPQQSFKICSMMKDF
ncbi:hypothetical protein, partial [Flagellimonas marinaquae]